MSWGKIFGDIVKRETEAKNGRIRPYPGNWVYEPTAKQRERGNTEHEDATGRMAYLVKQRSVRCPNPDVGKDAYPIFEESIKRGEPQWFVPYYGVCRHCEHYRKGGTDGLRYPHCAWARKQRRE